MIRTNFSAYFFEPVASESLMPSKDLSLMLELPTSATSSSTTIAFEWM